MRIPYYQIDAFTSSVFSGNPAGVCLLEGWLDDTVMQAIAAENNLSETAFLVQAGAGYELRWFTPKVEVDLCGHATLASAFVIFTYLRPSLQEVSFESIGGPLTVGRKGDLLSMDFPSRRAERRIAVPEVLSAALGAEPEEVWVAERDHLAVFADETLVRRLSPDATLLARLGHAGTIATAPGDSSDFVSRFFAPNLGVFEDPVTGSAHCTLVPYWADRLGKCELHALQVSERGGELFCAYRGERVGIAGHAVIYCEGTLVL